MVIFYHSKDMDGISSAAIIKLKYPKSKLIGWDYGDDLPEIKKDEDIIVVDISFPMEHMHKLAKKAKSFVWIDHHISAINDYNEFITKNGEVKKFTTFEDDIITVLKDGRAACEGTWDYIFKGEKMPLAIKYLGEYDTFRKKSNWNSVVMPFQYGIRSVCNSVDEFPMGVLEDDKLIDEIVEKGKIILEYQNQVNEKDCEVASFECKFEGLNAICMNSGEFNVILFESIYDEKKHDIMIPFRYDGELWKFSLYTSKDNIDCSELAKKHGGGGHKQAAGFEAKELKGILPIFK